MVRLVRYKESIIIVECEKFIVIRNRLDDLGSGWELG